MARHDPRHSAASSDFSTGFKRAVIGLVFLAFAGYTLWIDAGPIGLKKTAVADPLAADGKLLYQKYNCQACHQIYGLGGYMGPDLTNEYSQPGKGPAYMSVFLKNGTDRMPNFHLAPHDVSALIAYLGSVDASGAYPANARTTWYGSIELRHPRQ
jgi:nitric oxide reductase subunit C